MGAEAIFELAARDGSVHEIAVLREENPQNHLDNQIKKLCPSALN